MVTIHEEPDCGNAPRKKILRDLVVAVVNHDSDFIDSLLHDHFVWNLFGDQILTSRDAVREWVTAQEAVDQVTFGSFLTHGRAAGVDGTLDLADGTRFGFCHIVRFAGAAKTAKIVGVNSYLISTPTG